MNSAVLRSAHASWFLYLCTLTVFLEFSHVRYCWIFCLCKWMATTYNGIEYHGPCLQKTVKSYAKDVIDLELMNKVTNFGVFDMNQMDLVDLDHFNYLFLFLIVSPIDPFPRCGKRLEHYCAERNRFWIALSNLWTTQASAACSISNKSTFTRLRRLS